MKSTFTIITLFAIALLAVTIHGQESPDEESDFGDKEDYSSSPIIATTVPVSNAADDTTTALVTDTNTSASAATPVITTNVSSATTSAPTTMQSSASANSTVTPMTSTDAPANTTLSPDTSTSTTTLTNVPPDTNTTSPLTTTKNTEPTTTAAPGRKFDGLSFLGGIILALGIGALAFLVVRYLRRSNRMPYANLQ